MKSLHRAAAVAAVAAVTLVTAGCQDFLTGEGISTNPNQPVDASAQQLFVAAQAQGFVRQQGQLARTASMLVQQLSGINNQQRDWVSRWQGTEGDYNFQFSAFYTGGGLVDWRRIQEGARAQNDPVFEGIAKVWEAYMMGTAASIWGDLPYREAVNAAIERPALDPQQQVYADVLALLTDAINLLGQGTATPAVAAADLVFGGNTGRWIRTANTLKARYHLHLVERNGDPEYAAALAAAQNGINEAPTSVAMAVSGQAPGNFRAFHGNTLETGNLWAQFLRARQDIVAGETLVNILNERGNDPRRENYFNPVAGGIFRGANQLGIEAGGTASLVANVTTGTGRVAYDFRQPLITWAENQLIMAEAHCRPAQHPAPGTPQNFSCRGDMGQARTHLNNVRTAVGLPALTGTIDLRDIMIEKYITMFQNIEAWNDFKRTCIPRLSPPGNPQLPEVPGRVPYGLGERENNPNIPLPGRFPEGTTGSSALRNWNDPNPCPLPGQP